MNKLTPQQMAWRVAQDIPEGSYVHLGSGMPLLVSDHVPASHKAIFRRDNDLLGIDPLQPGELENKKLINAGSVPVTVLPDGSFSNLDGSVTIVRGYRLDYRVLGACQVSAEGDLALQSQPQDHKAPIADSAIGITSGTRKVLVLMEYFGKDGSARIVPRCTSPVTELRCVTSIYTDIAVLDLVGGKVILRELIEGISLHTLQAETDVELSISPSLRLLQPPVLWERDGI